MKEIEIEGKTVTIAVESGLSELKLRRDQVEVEVLQEPATGFLGLGSKPAKVRIREKLWGEDPAADPPPKSAARSEKKNGHSTDPPKAQRTPSRKPPREKPRRRPRPEKKREGGGAEPEKACAAAEEVLGEILSLAGLGDAGLKCSWDNEQSRVIAEVDTPDAGLLIGKGGRTIEALQFLVTVIVGRKTGVPTAIQVETQGYWKKIEGKVFSEAERAIDEVRRTGDPYRFQPMEPALRRLVHRKMVDHPDVETASEGEGPWRKVVVKPRRK